VPIFVRKILNSENLITISMAQALEWLVMLLFEHANNVCPKEENYEN
jgi:hypothetical protein